ncbi:hypothetical protein KP79_PYT13489 [Mizuhopecten yessoensis]|uniref:Uncharacterized protein n=1 Tax=Mizuhopecten yessoensis TaxID=6573 RepID=A0A210QNK2_MIZYE|nr:hypothetical protein KP79_PYT13489 [Mizuhopecten yessoensis]
MQEETQERIISRHAQMVNDLSDHIYKESEDWLKFTALVKAYMPPKAVKDNLQQIVDYLIQQQHISYGHYDKLYEVVFKINKAAADIIKKAESDIKAIQDGEWRQMNT